LARFKLFRGIDRSPADKSVSQNSGAGIVQISLKELAQLSRFAGNVAMDKLSIRSILSGNYLSKVKGRGMEFDEVRMYMPGDDVRSLDWRVMARTGKPHTKLYREERERPVFISVDYRSAMFFATRGAFKSVLAAKLAALIAWGGNHHSDRVGGQIFTDTQTLEFKPRRGIQAILHFLKHLAELSLFSRQIEITDNQEPNASSAALNIALDRLYQHARPGSLIFLIGDFRGMNTAAEAVLARLSRHCDLVLVLVYDRFESDLPPKGKYRISVRDRKFTLNTADTRLTSAYHQKFLDRYTKMRSVASKNRMRFLACTTTDEPLQVLQGLLAPPTKAA